jgi:RNA polymerase sigma factor (sigma-70 family)
MEKINKRSRLKKVKKSFSNKNKKGTRNSMNTEYDSLSEYVSLAKKTINKFAPKFYNGLNKEMLNNEDAVSDVATAIMYADWRYDPNRSGASGMKKTLYSYRNQCAIWAIQTYITNKYKKSKNSSDISLDFSLSNNGDTIYGNTISDKKQTNPLDLIIEAEEQSNTKYYLEKLLNSGIITDKQRQQLQMYYMEDMTLSEIGEVFDVSREAIRQNIKRAIETIRSI